MSILIIDNYDSFTYNLLQQCQHVLNEDSQRDETPCTIDVFRHDAITLDAISERSPQLIILSPGPGTPQDAGITLPLIARFLGQIPLFGVCLGMQALATHLGIPVTRTHPMHGKLSTVHGHVTQHPLLAGLPQPFDVVRYHSLHVNWQTGHPGTPLAYSDDGVLMALDATPETAKAFAWGVQFHPESIGSGTGQSLANGQQLLRNVCQAAGLVRNKHLV